jgi:hypothetical protein
MKEGRKVLYANSISVVSLRGVSLGKEKVQRKGAYLTGEVMIF